jgi:hypothetical protein
MPRAARASVRVARFDRIWLSVGDRIVALAERVVSLSGRRIPELIAVAAGLGLRISMVATYDPGTGYDGDQHVVYAQWFTDHWSLPDLMLSRVTYHPPLYYVITGAFARLVNAKVELLGVPSVVFSCAGLVLVWTGLERHLPGRRTARIVALLLAAILPAAVHLSGMVSAEALNGLLATAALLVAAETLRRPERGGRIIWWAASVGLLVALEMLAKISALAIVGTIGAAVGFELAFGKGNVAARMQRAAPWLAAGAVFILATGWYFARNHRLYGKAVLSGYDGRDGIGAPKVDAPYLERRSPEYFYGWTNDVLKYPYAPSGTSPRPYFWPVVVASTFVDHYSFGYVPAPTDPNVPAMVANGYPLPRASLPIARASAIGGAVVAASTALAWFWAVIVCVRRRATARLLLLAAPAFAIAGLLHFVVRYPYDVNGAIKGVYLQFAAGPLFALFGLAVHKMMRRRATWPIALVQCAAVVAIAGYTIYARVFAV